MSRIISRETFDDDRATLLAVQSLSGYAPTNPAYSLDALFVLQREAAAAIELTQSIRTDLVAARADEIAKLTRLHEGVQQAKLAVQAQYGKNSFAVQAIGLKRRVDYKRRRRKSSKATEGAGE